MPVHFARVHTPFKVTPSAPGGVNMKHRVEPGCAAPQWGSTQGSKQENHLHITFYLAETIIFILGRRNSSIWVGMVYFAHYNFILQIENSIEQSHWKLNLTIPEASGTPTWKTLILNQIIFYANTTAGHDLQICITMDRINIVTLPIKEKGVHTQTCCWIHLSVFHFTFK